MSTVRNLLSNFDSDEIITVQDRGITYEGITKGNLLYSPLGIGIIDEEAILLEGNCIVTTRTLP